jgi:hypothetical protein
MKSRLSEEEEQFVHELETWERSGKRIEHFFYTLFLVLGGAVIVTAGYVTVQHLTDRTALSITVPGFLLGLLFIGLHLGGGRRMRDRSITASILKKLRGAE